MNIAVVASEAAPYCKTGDLAEVVSGLSTALVQRGHEVDLYLPCYREMKSRMVPVPSLGTLTVRLHDGCESALVVEDSQAGQRIPGLRVIAIEADGYFDRAQLYGEYDRAYADNARRFSFFSRAVLLAMRALGREPDVIHCHDWQTALLPAYAKLHHAALLGRCGTVLTVHDMAHQGVFPAPDFPVLGLPRSFFSIQGCEFYGRVNFLKAGLVCADQITTVSPRYAREIATPQSGWGLEGVLAERTGDLCGIRNGIDYTVWDPQCDPHLVASFQARDARARRRCKADLLVEAELDGDLSSPIVGAVTRLDSHTGIDLLLQVLPRMIENGIRCVILGQGDPSIEAALTALVRHHPGRLVHWAGCADALAHKIFAGADICWMPLCAEPCGLTPMMAMRYGAIPVAREVGGLADTIVDHDRSLDRSTGFTFREASADALLEVTARALRAFANPTEWDALRRRAMSEDFSWAPGARQYEEIYERARRRSAIDGSAG